ncbi:MAG: plasmid stabilization protein, partial [Actinobacteria bacterium]|nr:plasmid stabilization protein [Actinomycetota bacterium]
MKRAMTLLMSLCLVVAAACGGSDDSATPDASDPSVDTAEEAQNVLRVPGDFPTIQAAVDASQPGDLILIAPGVYTEAGVGITVETPDIVIRGEDRNEVIIDGEFTRDNGIKVFSDGVAVENLTVRNHTANGIFFTGEYNDDTSKNKILTGWRASYVTAYNNGLYGVYGFNATKGQIDNSYGSGHPDSAFYVGQCNP